MLAPKLALSRQSWDCQKNVDKAGNTKNVTLLDKVSIGRFSWAKWEESNLLALGRWGGPRWQF